jgi:peptidyl-prolyl cis-trans isomerase C
LPQINLSSEIRNQLIEDFESIHQISATPSDIDALEQGYLNDELLFKEALASDIHLIDPNTRSSLIDIMRFRMAAMIPIPTDAELVTFYAENIQNYYSEATLSFEHIYFVSPPSDVDMMIPKLAAGERIKGDEFVHGERFTGISAGIIGGFFGEAFLTSLQSMPISQWAGPITSRYGVHFIHVDNKIVPKPIPFLLIKEQIAADYMQAQVDRAVQTKVESLSQQYEINIEP